MNDREKKRLKELKRMFERNPKKMTRAQLMRLWDLTWMERAEKNGGHFHKVQEA